MQNVTVRVTLAPVSPTTSAEETEDSSRLLRDQLLETSGTSVEYIPDGHVPDGTRVVDPITIGALLVTLAGSGSALTALIETVKEWLGRNSTHTVTLEAQNGSKITITGQQSAEDKELLEKWTARNFI